MVSIAPGVPPCPPILGEPNAFSPRLGGRGPPEQLPRPLHNQITAQGKSQG